MKKNKIIIIIVVAIVLFISIDVFLVFYNKKQTEQPNEEPKIVKRISCFKEENKEAIENGISYRSEEEYAFFIASDNKITPDVYNINLFFNTLEDLNAFYTYSIDTLGLNPSNLSKNEQELNLLYSRMTLQGGYEYYEEKVLEDLTNVGYSCNETELEGTGER